MDLTVGASRPVKKSHRISKSDSLIGSNSDRTSLEFTLSRVHQIELAKFCPRKFFYIFLVAENDSASALLLDDLVEISKTYEEVSSVTFISRHEVLALLDTTDNLIFPKHLKPLLLNVIESYVTTNTPENNTLNVEAQLLKLKLIQVMYQQYVDLVKRNEKEKNLETLLSSLSKECKRKQKKEGSTKDEGEDKNKNPLKDDGKTNKKNKTTEKSKDAVKDEEIDYTSIPIDKNGITYEENIFDYIWFYCIKGYYNADIIHYLTDQVNVPVTSIVKISTNGNQSDLNVFWHRIMEVFCGNTTHYKSLQNTILMEFTPSEIGKENSLVALEEFVYMLRRIVNLKLTYIKYLKHLKINRIKHSYIVPRMECLERYIKSLRFISPECINTELILDGILKEVCFTVESNMDITDTPSIRSLLLARNSHKSVQCIDPLHDFDAFSNIKRKEPDLTKSKVDTFLVAENDVLTTILKSYKYVGPKVADTTLNFIQLMPILYGLNDSLRSSYDEILHLHDRNPSEDFNEMINDVSVENFLYIFLFNTFSNKMPQPQSISYYDLLNNLTTFNINQFWDEIQSKVDRDITPDENTYDTPMINFLWKENLNRSQLIQEVYAASNEFLYVDRKFSPETDNFLLIFSDKLDDFGTNVKMVDVLLRTPVCFRDFCRYSVIEEAKWIETNTSKINETTFKVELDENCPGAEKVKAHHLHMFQEYAYLLDGDIKEEVTDNVEEDTSYQNDTFKENNFQGINFSDILTDLEKCSTNMNIIEECENAIEGKERIAYNLGTNLFKVTGKLTTFCSHDNVKVIVDNTRILQYPEKCTFNVISDGYILTLHSRESLLIEPYIATLHLKDDSRISFAISKNQTEPETSCDVDHSSLSSSIQHGSEELGKSLTKSSSTLVIGENNQQYAEQLVHYVEEDYIKELLEGSSLDDILANENQEDLIESLLLAKENNGIIYKVNAKPRFLIRKNSSLKVPLESAFRNIVSFDKPNESKYHHNIYTKRFESPQDNKSDLEVTRPIDFRICLPNGLFVRTHSGVINKNILMIKQEYVDEKPNIPAIQHEEFRLFSNQGLVVIKKVDGTITILRANGDIIDFEKPSDGPGENSTVRPCHCSTLEDFRKKLNKLLKDQENCDFTTSRRGHITSKQNHILDSKILKVLEQFDVPYLKASITKFDGKRIKIQGDQITQKQLFYVTSEQDFSNGEIFFERNDDFRSKFDKNGFQRNIFPDGTIISNSVDVNDELIDDFVDVELSYKYEHPNYATVRYDFDKTVEIGLNNNVSLKENVDRIGFSISVGKELLTTVSSETISIQKTCPECLVGRFEASFDIEPFRSGVWNPLAKFMHVTDSYEKYFFSDFIGNCSRNSDYMKGSTNSMNCNHVLKRDYKRLFVINRDFTGDLFHTNANVTNKIKEVELNPDGTVNTYNVISNDKVTVIDCRRKFYASYCDRFYNNFIHEIPWRLRKTSNPRSEFYTTFRVFHEMFESVANIAVHVANLKDLLVNEVLNNFDTSNICENVSRLIHVLEENCEKNQLETLVDVKKKEHTEDHEKKGAATKCLCIRRTITMEEKMSRWRQRCYEYRAKIANQDIPDYFKSEFCHLEQ